MHLSKIEVQGFKSFAHPTTLTFAPGITAVVGPNGSGKSNIADAIRWVLGEQSTKTLRAKKGEDVIFSGSHAKSRLGFAEVSLTFDNNDQSAPLEYPEIVITRRLYRDGESDYLLNKSKVRLNDILMFLAKANFGQKSYAVVGQGMIDSVINATPEMRKDFFDEAVGVKPHQMKRDAALHKLQRSEEHLQQSQALLAEIEPRLRSLTRQIKKLEKRTELEQELRKLQISYYSSLWTTSTTDAGAQTEQLTIFQNKRQIQEQELQNLRATIDRLAGLENRESLFRSYQSEEGKLQAQQQSLLKELTILKGQQELHLEKIGQSNVAFIQRQLDDYHQQTRHLESQLSDLRQSIEQHHDRLEHRKKEQIALVQSFQEQEYEFLKNKEHQQTGTKLSMEEIKGRLQKLYEFQEQFLSKILATNSLPEFQEVKKIAKKISFDLAKLLDELDRPKPEDQSKTLDVLRRSLEQLSSQKDQMAQEVHQLIVRWETSKQKQQMLESQRIEVQEKSAKLEKELTHLQASRSSTGAERREHFEQQQSELEQRLAEVEKTFTAIREKIHAFNREEQRKKDELIQAQHAERSAQDHFQRLQAQMNDHEIALARLQTRLEDLDQEMNHELPEEVRSIAKQPNTTPVDVASLEPQIDRLKKQLEQIGGIDPETRADYEQTKERFDFLSTQSTDLEAAIETLNEIIDELDTTIQKQFHRSFLLINKHFDQYFQILFEGGHAKLSLLQAEETEAEPEVSVISEGLPNDPLNNTETPLPSSRNRRRLISGIEISASPPGKKLKHLSFLSGGEKALTSIALICAIIANNPPPFILLDEVEAALDEANSQRFAAILKHLEKKTQFIIITHNRVIMHQANVIYGVTMSHDGISRLLSVKIEDLNDKLIGKNGPSKDRQTSNTAKSSS